MRYASVLMALVFLFGAGVQYNDPDPLRWIIFYLAASALSFSACRWALPWWLPAGIGGLALLWASAIVIGVDSSVFRQMFGQFGMASLEIEEAREAAGLVIIAGWLGVLAFRARSN